MEYLEKAVEYDCNNVFAAIDLLKVYMANVSTHKIKMDQMFADPAFKKSKHYGEILLLKAVYSYMNGICDESVRYLIEAVNTDAKCIDSIEVVHESNLFL